LIGASVVALVVLGVVDHQGVRLGQTGAPDALTPFEADGLDLLALLAQRHLEIKFIVASS
jgi:hypothetical protein